VIGKGGEGTKRRGVALAVLDQADGDPVHKPFPPPYGKTEISEPDQCQLFNMGFGEMGSRHPFSKDRILFSFTINFGNFFE
jgi:hypothetical protein